MEYTARGTPQQNGVVERSFTTDLARANAMMLGCGFTDEAQELLWPYACKTAEKMGNLVYHKTVTGIPDELFYKKASKLYRHLHPFGQMGYVALKSKIKGKFTEKSVKCICVGYSDNHSGDTYDMYNPEMKKILTSRDVKFETNRSTR